MVLNESALESVTVRFFSCFQWRKARWRSFSSFINPRRACAARVTVLGSVRVCVCVCVCVCLLSHISPTERLFVLKTLSRTQRAKKVKIFVGICLKRLRSRVMPRNMSEKANNANYSDFTGVRFLRLTHSEGPEGTQRLSTTFSLAQNYAY